MSSRPFVSAVPRGRGTSRKQHGIARCCPLFLAGYRVANYGHLVVDLDETRAKWRQVFDLISARIADGTYPPDTRVPSVLQLSEEFGIASATGQKVMRALREADLIRTEPGMGSYVNRR